MTDKNDIELWPASADHMLDDKTGHGVFRYLRRRGLTFKAEVEMEGIQTRAVLDHGT